MNYYDNEYQNRHVDAYKQSESFYGDDDVVSIGQWILILIGISIPFIGLIVTLILAFGSNNENLKNFGKAVLILMIFGLFFGVLLGACSS
ncbi:hypothetical protein [Ornithinibacillus californiensis]|uniref:hypothetical protein n=1 Tax=Ornithinibacillus californiensis TaxID=161536 RepID=UPI00064E1317|nr:hypothetical protein [Ornithinibacillus californiensis]